MQLDRTACERAARARDPRFDGRFFVGVRSTGIYCRPICPAVPPHPRNATYYPSAAAAAEAGLRPCLRCRPEAAPSTPAWDGTSTTVRRALRLIHEGALDAASVDELAARLGIGARQLHRLFVEHLGAPPIAFAQTRRLHFAKRLLDESDLPMSQVALASGHASLRRFNAAFHAAYDRPPSALRRARRATARRPDGGLRLMLTYRPPYDWDDLLLFLAARAIPGVESVADGAYHRVVRAGDGLGTIAVRHRPRERALELELAHADALATFAIVSRVRALFDLAADPAPIRRALGADPVLAPAVAARPGLRLPGAFDPFELAVRAVLGQQVSVAAARTLAARLVARCGERLDPTASGDEPQLTRAFPTAQALASANLDGLGITGARVESVRALASAWRDGRIDVTSDPQALRSTLAVLPGMGPWTREIIALRAGGDPDAFPAGDLGLRKALGRGVPLSESALTARAEAWRPWRGYAVFYLWTLLAPDSPRRRRGRPPRRSRG